MESKERSHCCSGLLEHYMNIRFCNPYPKIEKFAGYGWWLLEPQQDCGCEEWYLEPICKIAFCPFCGEKLTL